MTYLPTFIENSSSSLRNSQKYDFNFPFELWIKKKKVRPLHICLCQGVIHAEVGGRGR